ncbi:MAG: hypothetical protein J0H65_02120 [Rhizobiales bacterium]|nr:hypothetical protein [Hyphomicrobiales bacterium]
MTALPVAFYLKELSGEASRLRGAGVFGAEDAADLDFRIKEAHARGIAEGRAAVHAEHEAAVLAEAAAFEQRLVAERQAWASEQGERLATQIGEGLETVERRISDLVSDALKPVLREQIRVKAVEELARTLNILLSKGAYARIAVSGPADLVDRMKTAIAADHAGLSFVEGAGVEVTVSADDTILATQIEAWVDALSEDEA